MDAVTTRIPTWKAGLLTHSGRVRLTKITLSAIPVHIAISCCLSKWAIEQIDKPRRSFSVGRDGFDNWWQMQGNVAGGM